MACNSTHMASYTVHDHLRVFLFVGVINGLEECRTQLHHACRAISDKELTAAECRLQLLLATSTSISLEIL